MPAKRTAQQAFNGGDGNEQAKHMRHQPETNNDPTKEYDDNADEELDPVTRIPVGWRDCPNISRPIGPFIAMKVPLGQQYNKNIEEQHRFNINNAFDEASRMVAPTRIGMVIDLTKSSRYNSPELWMERNVKYVKIPLRGRGEAPSPEQVNEFIWEVMAFRNQLNTPPSYILVHCTHGFNRSGFMIVSFLMRMTQDPGYRVEKALFEFSQARPPGIYKQYYIEQLFAYYHNAMPKNMPSPQLPEWKAADGSSPDRADAEVADAFPLGAIDANNQHDDLIGEAVNQAEANNVASWMELKVTEMCNNPPRFPGAQPVSLDKGNLDLLKEKKYWVTWKADGTRYLLAIFPWGTYLMDRRMSVRRIQMRWPTPLGILPPGQLPTAPIGPLHSGTLLDGEMVVDEDKDNPNIKTRRFLAYDMMALNQVSLVNKPWSERMELLRKFVEEPREVEKKEMLRGKWVKVPYKYDDELFRFRKKHFWQLKAADKVLRDFIKNQVLHESDGLIFQGYNDRYVPGTQHDLLKWKFAHMNSVDFLLKTNPRTKELQLLLLETRKDAATARGLRPLPNAKIIFPNGEDPHIFLNKIVECAWNAEQGAWSFMRIRADKEAPNAMHVFESVERSIKDDIREVEVLAAVDEALKTPPYDDEMGRGASGGGGQKGIENGGEGGGGGLKAPVVQP